MPSTTEITVSQLSRLIGLPQTPIIIDVRAQDEFAADPRLIPGAQRRDPEGLMSSAARLEAPVRHRCLPGRLATQPRRQRLVAASRSCGPDA